MNIDESCNDPNCDLTRKGIQHSHKSLDNISQIELDDGEYFIAANPKPNIVYVSNNKADSILVIDGTSKKVVNRIQIERPRQLVVNADTNSLYAISGNAGFRLRDNGAKISIIDTISNQITNTIGDKEGFGDIKLNHDTNLLYATQTNSKQVWVIDTITNSVTEKIKVGAKYRSIAIDSASNTIYLGGREGRWNKVSFAAINGGNHDVEKISGKTPFNSKKVWELYFNPNNRKLYALIEEPDGDNLRTFLQVIDIESKSFTEKKYGRTEQDRIALDIFRNRIYFSKTIDGEILVLNDSLEEVDLIKFIDIPQSSIQKHFKGYVWPTKIETNPELDLIYIADGKNKLLHIIKEN